MKYDAFISYRHAPLDIQVSELLHKKLETLRVPRTIQEKSGKKRITRVFRDQEELTVSSSLSDEILSALDNSEYLIVICSPRTPESEWVNNEVLYFIEKHGRDKVLPVLIEGEPRTSFPAPLLFEEKHVIDINGIEHVFEQQSEPLAADFRADTRKERVKLINREIFRLAAPLLGCQFDDLKQRHRERKNRNLAIVLLALFTAVVAFGAYNYWQNQRISEEYRKQQINQSMFLADTSVRLFEQGDRTKSILVALEALPKDADNPDRPVVRKAEYALTQALQIYQNSGSLIPQYSIELDDLCTEKILCSESDKIFAVMDRRGTVYICELSTGKEITKRSAPDVDAKGDSYTDFTILSDDRVICYGLHSAVCLDGGTGAVLWEIIYSDFFAEEGYKQYEANQIAVSGDESSVAFAFDGFSSIILLSSVDGTELRRCSTDGLDDYLYRITLSYDGSRIALAHQGEDFSTEGIEIVVIDTETSAIISRISDLYANCNSLLFIDDETLLFGTDDLYDDKDTSNYQDGSLILYDISAEQIIWGFDYHTQAFSVDLQPVDLQLIHSETYGDRVLLVADEKIMLLDPANGNCVQAFEAPVDIAGIHYGEESGTCVYSTVQGQVKWVNLYDGTEYSLADFSIDENFFSMDGGNNTVVFIPMESQNVLVYSVYDDPDYQKSMQLDELDGFYQAKDLSLSADGQFAVIQSFENNNTESDISERAYIVDIESGDLEKSVSFPSPVEETIILPNEVLFVTEDGAFIRYDFETKKTNKKKPFEKPIFHYSVSGDNKRIAAIDQENIYVIDTESLEILYTYVPDITVEVFYLSGDGKFLFIQNADSLFCVQISVDKVIPFSEQDLHLDASQYAVFAEGKSIAAIPGSDKRIHIVDLVSGHTLSYIDAIAEGTFTGCFIKDDSVLVFQSDDGRIRAADVTTGELLFSGEKVLYFITDWIRCPERKTLAVISDNGDAILLSTDETIQPIAYLRGFCGFLDRGEGLVVLHNNQIGWFPYRDLKDLLLFADDVLKGETLSEANRVKYYIDD